MKSAFFFAIRLSKCQSTRKTSETKIVDFLIAHCCARKYNLLNVESDLFVSLHFLTFCVIRIRICYFSLRARTRLGLVHFTRNGICYFVRMFEFVCVCVAIFQTVLIWLFSFIDQFWVV